MNPQEQVYTVVSQPQMQPQFKQQSPIPSQPAQQIMQQPAPQPQPTVQQMNAAFPAAPEKPAKPFDLFFKQQMDLHAGDTNFDRQSYAEQCRQEVRFYLITEN